MAQTKDEIYVDLARQLEEYDQLLEQLQASMSKGFYNLSRANFHNKDSLRGKYGMDYYDENYIGQFQLEFDEKEGVFSKVPIVVENNEELISEENELKVKSRKTNIKKREKNNDHKRKDYDPIIMFGGCLNIPSSLRQSQSTFKSCVPLFLQIINNKKRIDEILKELK